MMGLFFLDKKLIGNKSALECNGSKNRLYQLNLALGIRMKQMSELASLNIIPLSQHLEMRLVVEFCMGNSRFTHPKSQPRLCFGTSGIYTKLYLEIIIKNYSNSLVLINLLIIHSCRHTNLF